MFQNTSRIVCDYLDRMEVNAMDIIAVHKASQWARQWTLDGKGPVLLEMVTYRYGGHSYVYFTRRSYNRSPNK